MQKEYVYKILKETNIVDLAVLVNEHLQSVWWCKGGLVSDRDFYYQAVVTDQIR